MSAHSDDLDARIRRYLISMGIRTVCVILALVVGWPWRWIFIVGAVGLPYIAVIMANVAGGRTRTAVPKVEAQPLSGLGGGAPTERTMRGETVSAQTFPDEDFPLGADRPWTVTGLSDQPDQPDQSDRPGRPDQPPIDLTRVPDEKGQTPGPDTRHTGPREQTPTNWSGTTIAGETVDPPGPSDSAERLNQGSGERTA